MLKIPPPNFAHLRGNLATIDRAARNGTVWLPTELPIAYC